MDGAHEGAYAWLTLNYLLGKLDSGPRGTVAAIDLGGGSVQEAFALPAADAAAAPAGYVTQLRAGGATYNVYVHRCVPVCSVCVCALCVCVCALCVCVCAAGEATTLAHMAVILCRQHSLCWGGATLRTATPTV
jgi:hypothetical protein